MGDILVGVVSHERSRFADSQGAEGLGGRIVRTLIELGVSARLLVRLENDHDPRELPVDGRLAWASVSAQLRLEREWESYISPATAGRIGVRALRDRARLILACIRSWRPWLPAGSNASQIRAITRLLNIELSHLAILREAVASGASWALVLEDDAGDADAVDCARGILGITAQAPPPAYVNLSRSFANDELRIAALLTSSSSWAGTTERTVLTAERPVTNTVCAILYERSFIEALLAEWDSLPMTPVVPIDWKLNRCLMRMHAAGTFPAGGCWFVEPAPIMQRSMG